MMAIEQLRYVRLGTSDLGASVDFAQRILGLELVEKDSTQAAFRSDFRDHTLVFTRDSNPAQTVGFEVRDTARVSDRIGDAALLRIDEVHHSIALFPTDRPGIQHINHQVETGDDVMRSLFFLRERGVNITFGPGRHPSSSAKFLYFEGPDGMVFEYSSGVRSIADELLYRERQLRFDPKGFCQWGAVPQIREFK